MVANGGAEQVSNAYPVSRVADVLVGYNTTVAGSAAAGMIGNAARTVPSVIAATPMPRRLTMLQSQAWAALSARWSSHRPIGAQLE
jgi:hypothetical protein